MIPRRFGKLQPAPSIQSKPELITDIEQLRALGGDQLSANPIAAEQFPLRISTTLLEASAATPDDPIIRQFLPTADELLVSAQFTTDPVGDNNAIVMPGVIQKYAGRVLIYAADTCAVHCRFCFRRHLTHTAMNSSHPDWPKLIRYLHDHDNISEIILSGGDPLMLPQTVISSTLQQLQTITTIRRIRIHTRVPVAAPTRARTLCAAVASARVPVVVAIHINHPREITSDLATSCDALRHAGATLLSQTVLLRGVNDQDATLCELFEGLFALGVTPYYLHQLDRVRGAEHFEVPDREALGIRDAIREKLPGYLVPKLVREEIGALSKRPLE